MAAVIANNAPATATKYPVTIPGRLPFADIIFANGNVESAAPVVRHAAAKAPKVSFPVISSPRTAAAEYALVIAAPAGTNPAIRVRRVRF